MKRHTKKGKATSESSSSQPSKNEDVFSRVIDSGWDSGLIGSYGAIEFLAAFRPGFEEGFKNDIRGLVRHKLEGLDLDPDVLNAAIEQRFEVPNDELISEIKAFVGLHINQISEDIALEFAASIFQKLEIDYTEILEHRLADRESLYLTHSKLRILFDKKQGKALVSRTRDFSSEGKGLLDEIGEPLLDLKSFLKRVEREVVDEVRHESKASGLTRRSLKHGMVHIVPLPLSVGRPEGSTNTADSTLLKEIRNQKRKTQIEQVVFNLLYVSRLGVDEITQEMVAKRIVMKTERGQKEGITAKALRDWLKWIGWKGPWKSIVQKIRDERGIGISLK